MILNKRAQNALRREVPKSIKEKKEYSINMFKILSFDKRSNLIDSLFGFTLAASKIPITEKTAFEFSQKFSILRQMYNDRLITAENAIMIIVDALEHRRMDQSKTQKQKDQIFIGTLTYNLEETMMNANFIILKWQKQQKIDQENQKNQAAFLKFLEEQERISRKKAEEAQGKGWQCPVCCSEIDRSYFGILQCGHIFHPECINGFLKSKIQSNQIQISCPMQGCKHILQASQILNYIDGQLKQKYQNFSFNQFVEKNNSSTSWCPTAGCTAVFSFDADLDNYKCPACKKHYCLRCRCEFHVGMSCKEYKINNSFDKNDEAFIKFAQGAKFKQCPKCKYWVERNTGCPTMTCKCGQQFCYDCGGTACPHGSCSKSGMVGFLSNVFGRR